MYDIRELSILYRDAIEQLFFSVFSKEPWNDDWSDSEQLRMYITDLIGQSNSLTYGLYEGKVLIGMSMGHIRHWYSGTEYYIDELCICTTKQGNGLGTIFVEGIQKAVIQKGLSQIFLQTERDVPAYQFYKKLGFVELEGHVSFAKDLSKVR